jgi:hypothetical protein
MAEGYIDDRNGSAVFPGDHSNLVIRLTGPDGQVVGTIEEGIDLGPESAKAVEGIIRSRVITKDTDLTKFVGILPELPEE